MKTLVLKRSFTSVASQFVIFIYLGVLKFTWDFGQNIEINILIFQTLKQNNTDPVPIFCILKIKVSV